MDGCVSLGVMEFGGYGVWGLWGVGVCEWIGVEVWMLEWLSGDVELMLGVPVRD